MFKHNLNVLLLRFDNVANLINATESRSQLVETMDTPFEIFLKSWDENCLILYSYEMVTMSVQFSNIL